MPNPANDANGPVCPFRHELIRIKPGFTFFSSSYPNPIRAMAPGAKLSVTTSAHAASFIATSRPSALPTLTVMLCLPALTVANPAERSGPGMWSLNGPIVRSVSTRFGLSSLTTVAP